VLSSFCAKEENENKRKIMRDKYFFIGVNLEIKNTAAVFKNKKYCLQ
jgi:hypothetical protein